MRRRIAAVCLATMILAGPGWTAGGVRGLPLEPTDTGLLVVRVTIGGRGPYALILDTGSERTIVTPRVAASAGLTTYPGARLVTPAGARDVGQAWIPVLGIGPRLLLNHPVIVSALVPEARAGRGIDGVLGQDVLGSADYEIDVRARRLIFGAAPRGGSADGCASAVGGMRVPFDLHRGRMVIEATTGPHSLRLLLDSGATHAVLPTRVVDASPSDPSRPLSVRMADRHVQMPSIDTLDLRVGGRRLRLHRALLLDRRADDIVDGLLPVRLFDCVRVHQDQREATLVLR